jgi:hypothetical protein
MDLFVERGRVEYIVATSTSVSDAVESEQLTALFNNTLKNGYLKLKYRLPSVEIVQCWHQVNIFTE